jgi:hypothetical protein
MSIGTLSTEQIADEYIYAYRLVYGVLPDVSYAGNQWYRVDGQPVHYTMLVRETARLADLARLQHERRYERPEEAPTQPTRPPAMQQRPQRSMIQRIIEKLRGT